MKDLDYLKHATDRIDEATRILKEDNDGVRRAFSIPDGWYCDECNLEMDPIMSFCHKCRQPRPDYDEEPPDQYNREDK